MLKRWTGFYYPMDIYLDTVSCVFPVRPSRIFSLESCMLEVWMDQGSKSQPSRSHLGRVVSRTAVAIREREAS